jgi:hypothetical protein
MASPKSSIAAFAVDAGFSPRADEAGAEDVSVVDPELQELARRARATRAAAGKDNLTAPHHIG